MLGTSAFQRRVINAGMALDDIKKEWPYLFSSKGLLHHFRLLMDIDCLDMISTSMKKKGPEILAYLSSEHYAGHGKVRKIVDDAVQSMEELASKKPILPALILAIMAFFKEPSSSILDCIH